MFGGAQTVVIARKVADIAIPSRPRMTIISPSTMTTTPADRSVYSQLRPIVDHAAERLVIAAQ
jgi:hypothetical protein